MNWIRQFLAGFTRKSPGTQAVSVSPAQADQRMIKLMHALIETREVELGCDEVLQIIDQYAEALKRGEDPEQFMPMVRHHLDLCKECEEELQAVLEILRSFPPGITSN